ncbi:MAG: VTT domain-containing protein [Chloroflexota bacterium]|nr:VTT domain-containing protein [Chloroflexota bacterium]
MKVDRILARWWWLLLLPPLGWLVWRFGPDFLRLARDEQALEAFVLQLGWLGPVALVLFNVIQIVVAPIPGYMVHAAAGFLYGPLWGGIWGSIGVMGGAMAAMWLARTFGRPLVERMVGSARWNFWEKFTHSDQTLVWLVLMLSPFGDLPYFLAGLARVTFGKIALLTLLLRVPSVFIVAAIGSGAIWFSWWQITVLAVIVVGLALLFLRYQQPLLRWLQQQVQH